MTIVKTEAIQAQATTLAGCCQSDNISTDCGSSMEDIDERIKMDPSSVDPEQDDEKYSFPKREPVDVEFKDLRFTASRFSLKNFKVEHKEILHGVNGAFRSNELTAIMGPSGSGKTTLLNSLAGYVNTGVSGLVQFNGETRHANSDKFRHLAAYIHQDDELRPWLTTGESMMFAAHLKLGYHVSYAEKYKAVKKILFLLGLDKRFNTRAGNLSGGQKKRLAIALEMISNPPILYLDEPTTGLDSSSTTQCIKLLKRLAQQGRTVIATIHQPSALLFEMFDKLYAVTKGQCLYQGPVKELVPFLGNLGLHCPSYHNPADFLMEVAVGEYNVDVNKIIKIALKKYYEDTGKSINCDMESFEQPVYRSTTTSYNESSSITTKVTTKYQFDGNGNDFRETNLQEAQDSCVSKFVETPKQVSCIYQFLVLYQRYFMCSRRNCFLIVTRMLASFLTAILFGYIYAGVGAAANTALGNYIYLYGSVLFVVYTGKMAVMMSFPTELGVLSREHFNRWYGLGPYFLSVISFEIPVQVLSIVPYCFISYFLTGNWYQTDDYRFAYFTIGCIFATLAAQAWGFLVGSTLPTKIAVFIGPILLVLFSVFGFCTPYSEINRAFRWMWHVSYFRASFHTALNAVYGYNRTDMYCPDNVIYCHFSKPKVFLQEMDIENVNMFNNMSLVGGVIVLIHILTIISLWYKLNRR
ncbi:ATP-binding cassette sub-family G member 1 [Culicoides brevitarsis]|uniref:ATP-binding cassette sub-family G member 1 n=1 Tax=Culicoides brevitarsis TaxID=469753 RepID=UPI00307BEEC0